MKNLTHTQPGRGRSLIWYAVPVLLPAAHQPSDRSVNRRTIRHVLA
jgi:hypothetical protein